MSTTRSVASPPSIPSFVVSPGVALGVALAFLAGAAGCGERGSPPGPPAAAPSPPATPKPPALPPTPWRAAAIAHGGVGSPPDRSDGCRAAVDAALAVIEAGGDPHAAVVAGVKILEDDPRFNAGAGSRVRIDGVTVQMDASIMDSSGRFGAVAGIEQVKNPIVVARAVLDTPHLLLAGDGATRFARTLGLPVVDMATPESRARTAAIIEQLRRVDPALPDAWRRFDWRKHWNFERTLKEAGLDPAEVGHDTVGVAVRTADGRFAVGLSTGGTAITLRGRVGDVPILGAGLYAGTWGAVAATGAGERIMEAGLAREVVGWLAEGVPPAEAARRGVARIAGKGDVGLVVIGPDALAAAADRPMAWAGRELGSTTWQGPTE